MDIDTILKKVLEYNPKANVELIRSAYEFAASNHKKEKRESGEDYIQHPLNAAYILAEYHLDEESIAAVLLHDILENTGISFDALKEKFGLEIATLVDGVSNIDVLKEKTIEEIRAENVRKLLIATYKDIRVIIIKLADKLHNMRTIQYLSPERQRRIAKEALEIFSPIAYRLGMQAIKSEIENISFKILEPQKYKEIEEKVVATELVRKNELEELRQMLEKSISEKKIDVRIQFRHKNYYSIYKKMLEKNIPLEEVYDITALRIITKDVNECYVILGVVHNLWKHIPAQFNDYIAMPKPNMYKSLHTIILHHGIPVEIQIRTEEMHKLAEEGIAAHWLYKGLINSEEMDRRMSWLKEILEWQKDLKTSQEFIEALKIDFFRDIIFTFTPKGKMIELPKGGIPIDFAYMVHSDLGDKSIGAKVNGKFVSLKHELHNGDIIEIITSKNQKPSREWLKFVKTNKARVKIRRMISAEHKVPAQIGTEKKTIEKQIRKTLIEVPAGQGYMLKMSRCCNPLPGDKIVGVKKIRDVSIHRADCSELQKIVREKVEASWINDINTFVELEVGVGDISGIMTQIFNMILATGAEIESTNARKSGQTSECLLNVKPKDLSHLRDIIDKIKKLKGVLWVRIGSLRM